MNMTQINQYLTRTCPVFRPIIVYGSVVCWLFGVFELVYLKRAVQLCGWKLFITTCTLPVLATVELYNRLWIGHTYFTHSYLLNDEDPPICIPCNSLLTVEHILISCLDFDIIRQNFYTTLNLKDLFRNIHPKRIISFVHAIGLPNKL